MRIKVRGKKWRIRVAELFGITDTSLREISLALKLSPKRRLNTLIHEMLHALNPKAKEKTVKYAADKIAKVLWKDGWRRKKTNKP